MMGDIMMMITSKQIECLIREMIGTAAMRGNDVVIEDCCKLLEIISRITDDDLESLRGVNERIRKTCKHLR